MNSCGKRRQELDRNDEYIIKVGERAATARSHTSVCLVVVVAYMASDFIVISGYLRRRFQVLALN